MNRSAGKRSNHNRNAIIDGNGILNKLKSCKATKNTQLIHEHIINPDITLDSIIGHQTQQTSNVNNMSNNTNDQLLSCLNGIQSQSTPKSQFVNTVKYNKHNQKIANQTKLGIRRSVRLKNKQMLPNYVPISYSDATQPLLYTLIPAPTKISTNESMQNKKSRKRSRRKSLRRMSATDNTGPSPAKKTRLLPTQTEDDDEKAATTTSGIFQNYNETPKTPNDTNAILNIPVHTPLNSNSAPLNVTPPAPPLAIAVSTAPEQKVSQSDSMYMSNDGTPIQRPSTSLYATFHLHLPSWVDIMSLNVDLVERIPRPARASYAKAFDCVVKYMNKHNDITAAKLMIMFNKCVCVRPRRGGKNHWKKNLKLIITRCRMVMLFQWTELWSNTWTTHQTNINKSKNKNKNKNKNNMNKAKKDTLATQLKHNLRLYSKYARMGDYRKSVRIFQSKGLVQLDTKMFAKLRPI